MDGRHAVTKEALRHELGQQEVARSAVQLVKKCLAKCPTQNASLKTGQKTLFSWRPSGARAEALQALPRITMRGPWRDSELQFCDMDTINSIIFSGGMWTLYL